ncbi:MAG TPA: PEGA domain-containing protein [Armatimonadota bacterium]|nr:PEGA domain-containing protein [Armatimonadota bacterium]
MFQPLCRLLVLFLIICSCVLISYGAQEDTTPRLWLISVGVSKYVQPYQSLDYASDGAKRLADAFRGARQDGTTTMSILTNDMPEEEFQPTRSNIISQLSRIAQQVHRNDIIIFYFCGHGIEKNGKMVLLPKDAVIDTDLGTLTDTTIALPWLREKLDAIDCRAHFLLLDSCRENPDDLRKSAGIDSDALPVSQDFIDAGSSWQTKENSISATLYSCSKDQVTYHGADGSYFNQALVKGISGGAFVDYGIGKGSITISSLGEYVIKKVPELLRKDGVQKNQKPVLIQSTHVDVTLRPAPPFIAIPDFVGGEYQSAFAAVVRDELTASGQIKQVEWSQINTALSTLKIENSGLTDNSTAARLGKFINATYVLVGEYTVVPGKRLRVSAHLVKVESAEVMPSVSASCTVDPNDPQDYEHKLKAMTADLLSAMVTLKIANPTNFDTMTLSRISDGPRKLGALAIETLPPGAQVTVGGVLQQKVTPMTVSGLRPGKITMVIARNGYEDVTASIDIKSDEVTKCTYTLPPLQAALSIAINQVGAHVLIDGVDYSLTTPPKPGNITIPGLTLGTHTIQVKKDLYQDTKFSVLLDKANTTKEVAITLVGLPGTLVVSTVPTGMDVTVDGATRGKSLLTLPGISTGHHTVRVSGKGYIAQHQEFDMLPNGSTTLPFRMIEAKDARLRVETSPAHIKGRISINGKDRGEISTPYIFTFNQDEFDKLNDGQVHVEFSARGYESTAGVVSLSIGDETTCTLSPDEITTCSLVVQSIANVQVSIDGVGQGKTDSDGSFNATDLRPGTHTVKVMKDGYYSESRRVKIGRGEIKRIIMRLHSYLPPIP